MINMRRRVVVSLPGSHMTGGTTMRDRVDDRRLPSRAEIEERLKEVTYCACGQLGVTTCEICEAPLCEACWDVQLERCRTCLGGEDSQEEDR